MRANNAFEGVAREWHEQQSHRWTERHANKVMSSLERNIFPALYSYGGHKITQLAMRLLMLTFVRTVELRGARWEEFDLD